MNTILVVAAVIVALVGVRRLMVISVVRGLFRAGLADIGREALERQADHVHLSSRNRTAWRDASTASALADPLLRAGFDDAGIYSVDEIPGVVLHLMSKPDEGLTAIVYEHPRVGHWMEVVTRFKDGTSFSLSTSRTVPMDVRPGHPRLRMPEAGPSQLVERLRRERPRQPFVDCSPGTLVQQFEDAYAEEMAWRKQHGVSPETVARVIAARGQKAA